MSASYFHLQQTGWHSHTTQGVRSSFHVHSPLHINQLWQWNYETHDITSQLQNYFIMDHKHKIQCHQTSCNTMKIWEITLTLIWQSIISPCDTENVYTKNMLCTCLQGTFLQYKLFDDLKWGLKEVSTCFPREFWWSDSLG